MIFAKFGQSLMRWDPRPIHRDDHSLGDRATFQPDMSWDLGDLSDHVRPLLGDGMGRAKLRKNMQKRQQKATCELCGSIVLDFEHSCVGHRWFIGRFRALAGCDFCPCQVAIAQQRFQSLGRGKLFTSNLTHFMMFLLGQITTLVHLKILKCSSALIWCSSCAGSPRSLAVWNLSGGLFQSTFHKLHGPTFADALW